jgi:tRNA pseudouridine55 synthase
VIQRIIADRFVGRISQVPPAYSAVHVGGERAYRKARQGRGVNIPPRDVEIKECSVLSYEYPHLSLHVSCGSGTYIRSLAHDLGHLIRCGAYLDALRRTQVGTWSLADAVAPDTATWMNVIPLKEILVSLPRHELTEEQFEDCRCGRDIAGTISKNTIGWSGDLPVAILEPIASGKIHARKVL